MGQSYGHSTDKFVALQRFWILVSEIIFFVPSLLFFVWTMFDNLGTKTRLIIFFVIYSIPSTIFIDHGHF